MATTTVRGTAVHALVGGALASPTLPGHTGARSVLVAAGIVTPAGSYAAGKSQADVERLIAVPEILNDILDRHLRGLGI